MASNACPEEFTALLHGTTLHGPKEQKLYRYWWWGQRNPREFRGMSRVKTTTVLGVLDWAVFENLD
jgi:hypothetical protein